MDDEKDEMKNTLICHGVKLGFFTTGDDIEEAVDELERVCAQMGIEIELSGIMQLYDEACRLLEEC